MADRDHQQLSDFDNEYGKALLANAAMRLFLRQEARELAYVKGASKLSDEAIDAISALKTVRGPLLDGLPDERVARPGHHADRRRPTGVLDRELRPGARRADPPARAQRNRQTGLAGAMRLLVNDEWQEATAAVLGDRGVMQIRIAIALLRNPQVRAALVAIALLIVLLPGSLRRASWASSTSRQKAPAAAKAAW